MSKPKTVKEYIDTARNAGHDALGIANDPEALAALKRVKAKRKVYSYTYDPATGLYSMTAAALTEWLMDVQGRARLEAALSEALDITERWVRPQEMPVGLRDDKRIPELRKLVPKKEK